MQADPNVLMYLLGRQTVENFMLSERIRTLEAELQAMRMQKMQEAGIIENGVAPNESPVGS